MKFDGIVLLTEKINSPKIRFFWPEDEQSDDGALVEKERKDAKTNAISYMSDELGLHRVQNTSHSNNAVSLHLYSPPFGSCQVNLTWMILSGLQKINLERKKQMKNIEQANIT